MLCQCTAYASVCPFRTITDSPKWASTRSRMNQTWSNASTSMNLSWSTCITDFMPQSNAPSWFISMESLHSCSNSSCYTPAAQNEQKAETSRPWNSSEKEFQWEVESLRFLTVTIPSWNLTNSPWTLWYLRVTWATCCSFKASKKATNRLRTIPPLKVRQQKSNKKEHFEVESHCFRTETKLP